MKYLMIYINVLFLSFSVHSVEVDYLLEFGLVLHNQHGEAIGFKETTAIPIDNSGENSLYGLVVSKESAEDFTLGSVHILPKAHNNVHKIMGKTMIINGKGAVFMKTQNNDIPGDYEMEIYINGILYKTINYQLLSTI